MKPVETDRHADIFKNTADKATYTKRYMLTRLDNLIINLESIRDSLLNDGNAEDSVVETPPTLTYLHILISLNKFKSYLNYEDLKKLEDEVLNSPFDMEISRKKAYEEDLKRLTT